MSEELHLFALKNTLNEIRKAYHGIKSTFIFDETGQVIASDASITEKDTAIIVKTFQETVEKAKVIGGVDNLTIECCEGYANISHLDDLYLATITSKGTHDNLSLTAPRILVLAVIDLLKKITPALTPNSTQETEVKPNPAENNETSATTVTAAPRTETLPPPSEQETKPKNRLVSHQFIAENLKGLFVKDDIVHIDEEVLAKWRETNKNEEVGKVEIETFGGKTVQCKVKPIKSPEGATKGVVQVPQRILSRLEIKKGELVRVKPVTE